jgi:hypothetical protein
MASCDGWQFAVTHALDKVYPDRGPTGDASHLVTTVFVQEPASFQIAFAAPADGRTHYLDVAVDAPDERLVSIAAVELVPCDLAAFPDHDAGYERDQPGLFPDLLRPLADSTVQVSGGQWNAIWVDFRATDESDAGVHQVSLTLREGDAVRYRATLTIDVLPGALPPLPIVNSTWLYLDCLAQFYDADVFSEPHWRAIDRFMDAASRLQVNSLLAPVWTPPLDTERGSHRLTTQLVDISCRGGSYQFNFRRLDRWLDLCRKNGIDNLEMAHLFTQWGAHATPSIWVHDGDGLVERFGWHVPARDESYREFLSQCLPALRRHLDEHWRGRAFYHISDEPSGPDGLATYSQAREVVRDLLEGCTVIDALSDVDFYDAGAVAHPVVATDAVGPFLNRRVPDLWVYYCVAQHREVSNRFFALPSARNRVIGHQLFMYDCAGFLHWGFNFYNSKLSRRPINPFEDTTGSGAFLGGDPFIVYPGDDGTPLESIRYKVFAAAMYDLRAFSWLAALDGKETVARLIDTDGHGGRLRFNAYSLDPMHYLDTRNSVNARILELM